jgi:tetratricopeptide (TPR) repeat protein
LGLKVTGVNSANDLGAEQIAAGDGNARIKLGDMLMAQGILAEALKPCRDLSASYSKVGDMLMAQGNLAEAQKLYRDSLAIGEGLAKVDRIAGWQRDLVSYVEVGDFLMAQSNLVGPLKWYRDGLVVAARLAESQAQATSGSDGEPSASDTSGQSLTRVDCDKAGMVLNESANVCGSVAGEATAQNAPKSEAPETLSQPLTRADCDKARMQWSDSANVCGTKSEESKTQAASQAPPEAQGN